MSTAPIRLSEQPSSPTEYSLPPLSLLSSDSSGRRSCLADLLRAANPDYLQIPLGTDENGHPVICDLAETPHMLAGSIIGGGKGTALLVAIMSILMRATPEDAHFIMIDPKAVDLFPFQRIPHLLSPVISDCSAAAKALEWASAEVERRLAERRKSESIEGRPPAIIIVISELADLMTKTNGAVEPVIARIAGADREANIHLLVGTNRCSASVLTDQITEGFTCRLCGIVYSEDDAHLVLGALDTEALSLIGDARAATRGSMKMVAPSYAAGILLQLPHANLGDDIHPVAGFLREQYDPAYCGTLIEHIVRASSEGSDSRQCDPVDDPLLWDAAEFVVRKGSGSLSRLQLHLTIGHNRTWHIMDQLEEKGVVGALQGSEPRSVLIDIERLREMQCDSRRFSGSIIDPHDKPTEDTISPGR